MDLLIGKIERGQNGMEIFNSKDLTEDVEYLKMTVKNLEKTVEEPVAKAKPKPKPEDNDNIEVSRSERERPDGSKYFEVEYMDGSMEEIDIPLDNQSSAT